LICCARSLASSFAQDLEEQIAYALAPKRQQFRITVENSAKVAIVLQLLQQQMGHRVLIIGDVKRILHFRVQLVLYLD
jgi:protein-L-isoaspartate O-methyltransferase